jgi:hypothetical protein
MPLAHWLLIVHGSQLASRHSPILHAYLYEAHDVLLVQVVAHACALAHL